jgi:hypothetical protein
MRRGGREVSTTAVAVGIGVSMAVGLAGGAIAAGVFTVGGAVAKRSSNRKEPLHAGAVKRDRDGRLIDWHQALKVAQEGVSCHVA